MITCCHLLQLLRPTCSPLHDSLTFLPDLQHAGWLCLCWPARELYVNSLREVPIYLSVYLHTYLSIHPSIHPSVHYLSLCSVSLENQTNMHIQVKPPCFCGPVALTSAPVILVCSRLQVGGYTFFFLMVETPTGNSLALALCSGCQRTQSRTFMTKV